MNLRDTNQEIGEGKYITKRVMLNGQYVTLYSLNGQTWLSSPEDIPALMERLDNARITLNAGEKGPDGEGPGNVAKPETSDEDKGAPKKAAPVKYRMNGPKPRPILRQGGVVIQGTPIEPISASNATMSFSSDVARESEVASSKPSESKLGHKGKGGKASHRMPHKKMIAPVLTKPAGAKTKATKSAVLAKLVKGAKPSAIKESVAIKQAAAKTPAKTVSKASKKGIAAPAKVGSKAGADSSSRKVQSKKKPVAPKKAVAKKQPKRGRASKK